MLSKPFSWPAAACLALALSLLSLPASAAPAQGWGTVTGHIVLDGPLPKNPPVAIGGAKCNNKAPILKDELVVDKKTKGVRWALVWLTGVDDPKSLKPIPINPALPKMAPSVTIDQPCCAFEPRVLGMQEGQTLVIKNSSAIPHNANINFAPLGPAVNPLLPANAQQQFKGVKARSMPLMYTCNIHAWMKGYIGVFRHPYFAVTDKEGKFTIKDAPAGKYRLMAYHEQGWVIINPKNLKDRGKVITIKANGTTDVGKIEFKPS